MQTTIRRNRKLENVDDLFSQNAWDDINWTSEMLREAEDRINLQRRESLQIHLNVHEIELTVSQKWNEFYEAHGDKFFKDRKWIFSEFPEIIPHLRIESRPCSIFEVGCGVGNAVSQVVDSNENLSLSIYCCDLSSSAIETLKKRDLYKKRSKLKIIPFVADVSQDFDHISETIPKESVDFIMLIFTLSALNPEVMQITLVNLSSLLKPGGMILLRDYAQNDLTQLRFKGKSFIKDNYYVRADGTTTYFFSEEMIDNLFSSANLRKVELKLDKRILTNRKKALKMYRCWIQAKYIKTS